MLATYRVGALTKVPITKVFVKEAAGLCEGGWLLSDQGEPVLVGKHPHPHEWVCTTRWVQDHVQLCMPWCC